MYKLMFIDADGTLLTSEQKISKKNKEAVKYAIEKGVKIVLCSGRSYYNLIDFAKELDIYDESCFISSFNGSLIIEGNQEKVFKTSQIPLNKAFNLLKELKIYGGDFLVYRDASTTVVEKRSELIEEYFKMSKLNHLVAESFELILKDDVYKVMAVGKNDELIKLKEYMMDKIDDDINMFFSAPVLLEFTTKEATKGFALQHLAEHFGIDIKDTIAIGDSGNDESMIKVAGLGVAMINGEEFLFKSADYITENTNDQDGVAEVIYKFIK